MEKFHTITYSIIHYSMFTAFQNRVQLLQGTKKKGSF